MEEKRKSMYKRVVSSSSSQQQRRADLLQRQRKARRELTDHVRQLVLDALEDDSRREQKNGSEEMMTEEDSSSITYQASCSIVVKNSFRRRSQASSSAQKARYYSAQFSIPEWMNDVPRDMNGKGDTEQGRGWFVMARPEGKRCLMIAAQGNTITRLQNGEVLHRFASVLPNGSPLSRGPKDGWTLLDCIYHEADRTYYISDLLCWRSLELYDCTCEFRLFFLRSKYAEEMQPKGAGDKSMCSEEGHAYRIMPLLYYDCDPSGLLKAYQDFTPFQRDGLLFLNKQGYYELGLNPLMLLWKDRQSSRFFSQLEQQSPLTCVLSVSLEQEEGCFSGGGYPVSTLEHVVVGSLKQKEMEASGLLQARDEKGTEPAVLARFTYTRASTAEEQQGTVMMEGLQFEKRCSMSRAMADPWSKILFQSMVNHTSSSSTPPSAITFETILDMASHHVQEMGM